jgi:hypothetical protein
MGVVKDTLEDRHFACVVAVVGIRADGEKFYVSFVTQFSCAADCIAELPLYWRALTATLVR